MGFVQYDPEKRGLAQTLLLTGPIVGVKSAVDAPASGQIKPHWPSPRFHAFSSRLGLTADPFHPLAAAVIITLREADPLTLHRRVRPNLSRVRAAEARAVSGWALSAGEQAGQPGRAPAAGLRPGSESSHAH